MSIALLAQQVIGTAPVALYAAPSPAKIASAILTNPTKDGTSVTVSITRATGGSTAILTGFVLRSGQAHVAAELMNQSLAVGDVVVATAANDGSVAAVLAVST